jgi:hypothetical protein
MVDDAGVAQELEAVEAQWERGGAMTIFARAEEKEETDPCEVSNGKAAGRGSVGGEGLGMVEELNGDWFDSVWSGILIAPGGVEPGEAGIKGTMGVEAWVG